MFREEEALHGEIVSGRSVESVHGAPVTRSIKEWQKLYRKAGRDAYKAYQKQDYKEASIKFQDSCYCAACIRLLQEIEKGSHKEVYRLRWITGKMKYNLARSKKQ